MVLLPFYFRALWVSYVAQLFIHKGCECGQVIFPIEGVFKGLLFRVDNGKLRQLFHDCLPSVRLTQDLTEHHLFFAICRCMTILRMNFRDEICLLDQYMVFYALQRCSLSQYSYQFLLKLFFFCFVFVCLFVLFCFFFILVQCRTNLRQKTSRSCEKAGLIPPHTNTNALQRPGIIFLCDLAFQGVIPSLSTSCLTFSVR